MPGSQGQRSQIIHIQFLPRSCQTQTNQAFVEDTQLGKCWLSFSFMCHRDQRDKATCQMITAGECHRVVSRGGFLSLSPSPSFGYWPLTASGYY